MRRARADFRGLSRLFLAVADDIMAARTNHRHAPHGRLLASGERHRRCPASSVASASHSMFSHRALGMIIVLSFSAQ